MSRKEEPNIVEYYSLTRILKEHADYNVIYGERSNGKSFSVEELGIDNYINKHEQMAIIRREDVDIEMRNAQTTFAHFINNAKRGNIIEQKTKGKWNDITFFRGAWYLSKIDEKDRRIKDMNPFCFAFSLTAQEHYKSTSYPNITTILFDEFMTRRAYLPDEFILFQNLLSTIIRDRNNVKIFMCGNTVNMYNPYFKEMGLDNANKMKPGEIQLYEFAVNQKNEVLKIAVEFSDLPSKQGKPSDKYFAFGNPRLKMITNGMWELALYPHLPYKYTYNDICAVFFIIWEDRILQCEIVQKDIDNRSVCFIYIHNKTTPIQNDSEDLIFSTEYSAKYNWRRKITKPIDNIGERIKWLFDIDKVFYQDNEVGEIVRNYLQWCRSDRGIL